MRNAVAGGWLILALLATSSSLKADLVVADDMTDAHLVTRYSIFWLNGNPDFNENDVSIALRAADPNDGNPGWRMMLSHEHNVVRDSITGVPTNGNGQSFLQSVLVKEDFSYTPSVSGVINDISFSLDIKFDASMGPVQFSSLGFVIQDQFGGNAAGFTSIAGSLGWQTITVSGLTQPDFVSRNLSGNIPLSFGFTFTSSGDTTFGAVNLPIMSVDNFRVSINAVPEPSASLLVGSILVFGSRRSRIRQN